MVTLSNLCVTCQRNGYIECSAHDSHCGAIRQLLGGLPSAHRVTKLHRRGGLCELGFPLLTMPLCVDVWRGIGEYPLQSSPWCGLMLAVVGSHICPRA